nr:Chain E, possible peptide [unidentified]6FNZ_F Chain F, possible peptide [unidentified]6FNZ_G Chain G, possible peptide [unidentified]
PESSEG